MDHAEEHTIEMILDNGFWAGLTLYPQTKVSAQRAVDMLETYGPDRILVAGACDWGPSEPVAVPKFVMEMRRRKHSEAFIQRVVLENPDSLPQPVPEVQGSGRRGGSEPDEHRLTDRASCGSHRTVRSTSPTAPTSTPRTAGRRSSPR